jgi:hypothetical protein
VVIEDGSRATVETDDDGEYESGPLLPGAYTVVLGHHDCADEPRTVELEPGEDAVEDFAECVEFVN